MYNDNREGQEEINLRLHKRTFLNTLGRNSRIQDRHCILCLRLEFGIVSSSSLSFSLFPNDDDNNTLHLHPFPVFKLFLYTFYSLQQWGAAGGFPHMPT